MLPVVKPLSGEENGLDALIAHVFQRVHAALLCASWNFQNVRWFVLKYTEIGHKSRKVKDRNKCGQTTLLLEWDGVSESSRHSKNCYSTVCPKNGSRSMEQFQS